MGGDLLTLAYVEPCLPAASAAERLRLALDEGLALELADDGTLDVERYSDAAVEVASIQAYELHKEHPLHLDAACRAAAARHVRRGMALAAQLKSRRVVTICSYGQEVLTDRPLDRCLDFYTALVPLAYELGVRILIEPLSPLRTSVMNSPSEIGRLLDVLAVPEVFGVVLDTGHLVDSGFDLNAFLHAMCNFSGEA